MHFQSISQPFWSIFFILKLKNIRNSIKKFQSKKAETRAKDFQKQIKELKAEAQQVSNNDAI